MSKHAEASARLRCVPQDHLQNSRHFTSVSLRMEEGTLVASRHASPQASAGSELSKLFADLTQKVGDFFIRAGVDGADEVTSL